MAVQFVPGADARNPARARRYRRVEGGGLPFVPWGLAPTVALVGALAFGLGPFARRNVEDATRHAVADALAPYPWAQTEISGQFVTVRGQPPDALQAAGAIAAARSAVVPTWAGPLPPAFPVWDALGAPPPVWRDWRFRLDGATLVLAGEVPDTPFRDEVVAVARAKARTHEVEDRLAVAAPHPGEDVPRDALMRAAQRGLEVVSACDRGEASFQQGVFSARCELPASFVEQVRQLASGPLPVGTVGEVSLLANEAVASCEEDLGRLLGAATVEFATNSADVPPESAGLLDEVSRVALGCPGRLRVEGHTDSVGDPAYNRSLSQRRADAVRAELIRRGLPEERLVAEGFGDTRPKAGNASPVGQARNRRIEMRVIRSVE